MIWHPRADWVFPPELVTGPVMRWSEIDTAAIHYTAAIDLIDGDPGEDWAGIPAYLRRIHHDYLTNRPQANGAAGYSIGYNVAVDARGHAWELRGFDIKCAANVGHNEHTFAVLMLVDGQSEGSDAALEAARNIIRQAETRAGRELVIAPHSALAATQCCGDGLRRQIAAGLFSPRWTPVPPRPADPPSEEDDDMNSPPPQLIRFRGFANELLFACNTFTHGTAEQIGEWRKQYGKDGKAVVWEAHPQAMKGAFAKAGLDLGDAAPSGDGT